MPQINAVGGGRGNRPLRHLADNLDPFDDIAPSTVAMIILFGSIIFAAVGMATRDWLTGDKRAISAALQAHTTVSSPTNYSSKKDCADSDGDSRPRSVIKPQIIQPWEPTFVSTVVLFSQIGFLGIILFVIYSVEKSYAAEPMSVAGFDEDEFVFWTLSVLLYTYFVSWKRNDGKPEHRSNRTLDAAHNMQDDTTQTSRTTTSRRKMKEKIRQRTIEMASLRQRVEDGNGDDGASSQGSDLSKRLEEVLLTDDTVFDTILDTIGDDIQSKDESELGLLEKGSKFLGFNVDEKYRTICDVKRENDVLNRSQTLEWKGLLSVASLVYQYNKGEYYQPFSNENESSLNSVHVYDNLAKAAMSSLLFLTGYNHTYYFFHQSLNNNSVFKLSRVLQVCTRINLLAISMCLVLGKANYSVCLIHTSWFLLIWIMMCIGDSVNNDKYWFRLKLLIAAVGIFLFWDCNISRVVKINGAWEASQLSWEWYCASYLHHWSAFIGAIFAINQPIASLQLRKLESLNLLSNTFAKTLLSGTSLVVALIWAAGPLQKSATVYNVSHPYFGIIPTLLLINLRNVSCSLREHHIEMLSWLGKYSLEIFILHHHTSNVVLIRGYPRCNFLAVSIILIFTARLLHNTTSVIRHMLLPANEDAKSWKNTVVCTGGVMILYAVARILTWAEAVSLGTISTITMIVGILLYQVLTEMTWSDYRGTAPKPKKNIEDDDEGEEGSTTKVSPPLLATLFIFLLGYSLHQTVSTSSSHSCNPNHANKGHWIPLNACLARTKLDRNFNKMNYFGPTQCSTLNTTEQWTWSENLECFHYHSKLPMKLQEKRIVLIGDSSVRKLYHSLCRFAGDLTAGEYEGTSTSHSDASALFGSTSLEFKWAPLSVDIITKIKGMKASLSTAREEGGPDIIIAGGGVWDKLHLENTDEVQSSQEVVITTLASELKSLRKKFGVRIVWFVPPIINTVALNSDEKRSQISEGNVDEMRRMYAELGVLKSSSFILDGPQFTQDRVSDSYDGIHYPNHVYDAGSQIVMNALEHLLGGDANKSFVPRSYLPATSSLMNPYLGMMMLCFVLIGLFYFDGYFGVGYLAQVFVKKVSLSPSELYKDAFDHHPSTAQEQTSKVEYIEVQERDSIDVKRR